MCRKASVALFILVLGSVFIPTACAQYHPEDLFQFSGYWQQEPFNETSYRFNFDPGPLIDERDLLALIQEWKGQAPTETPLPNTPTATPTATWTPASGDLIIDLTGGVQMAFMLIPAGSFDMGSEYDPIWNDLSEQPVHRVTIGYDFYMGKTEITQAQWLAVMQSWPNDEYNPNTYSHGLGDNYPAYFITWNHCQNFVTAINQLGQGTFRLPSEAEWEYACRAGTTTRFYFGDSDTNGCWTECDDCAAGVLPGNRSDYMWYCGNNSPEGTKPVGQLIPNDFGLYDMHANVWEWCEDDWHDTYGGNPPEDGIPWVESPRAYYRVARGGYWGWHAKICRSACRTGLSTRFGSAEVGFRLVREVD